MKIIYTALSDDMETIQEGQCSSPPEMIDTMFAMEAHNERYKKALRKEYDNNPIR